MMQIRFLLALVFVFDKRSVLRYADQSRLRFVVKNICIPAYLFVLVLRYRLTNNNILRTMFVSNVLIMSIVNPDVVGAWVGKQLSCFLFLSSL